MTVRYEKKDGIGYFIIDNGKVNVFTPMMHKELYFHLREFELDADVRVGILMGADGRAFSAGADLKNNFRPERTREQELDAYLFLHQNEGEQPSRPGWEEDIMRLRRFKPIIGAVSGYCIGQGVVYLLRLTCIRIAGQSAKFGLPEVAYGYAGMSAGMQLAQHIPYCEAAMLLLTGDYIDAEEARRIHLINRVVPDNKVLETAEEVAAKVAKMPPNAVRVEMEALDMGFNLPWETAVQQGQNLYRLHRLSFEGASGQQNWRDKTGTKG
ncbi:enoyl-CoA hydratase/isomerase family protein [Pseudochelatococcus sp. B33]